jgi:23S rRNA (guanosine2251-2'-O)-methyltransferase
MRDKAQKILILENIRSTHNVGAMFRTADAIGITKIFLCGYTPAPIDRFGRVRPDIAKSALGAENIIPWESVESAATVVMQLKAKKVTTIALEQHANAVDYKTIAPTGDTAVVVGNEVDGVSQDVLKLVDVVAEIPMVGSKESLNVSVATGVLLFRLFDR